VSGGLPLVVISPHLDDAGLGCGQLLARHPGSTVITALAGRPPRRELTEWDAAAGFAAGDDVVGARRAEDQAALRQLGAQPVWLRYLDSQYGDSPGVAELAASLATAIAAAARSTVAIPLGLFHSDHILTHRACLRVVRERPDLVWMAYAEAMYRRIDDLLDQRIAALKAGGYQVYALGRSTEAGAARKRCAVQAYRSQLRALSSPRKPGYLDAFEPEGYWRLACPAPRAQEAAHAGPDG